MVRMVEAVLDLEVASRMAGLESRSNTNYMKSHFSNRHPVSFASSHTSHAYQNLLHIATG